MYRQRPPYRHGDGRAAAPPPQPPPQPLLNPNFLQTPNLFFQNPNLVSLHNPFLQNPNIRLPNPNFPIQNPNFPIQTPNLSTQNPNFRNQTHNLTSQPPRPKESLERIDKAVVKARSDLLSARESVLAWKVSQAALLILRADSWESLGFQMQQVPSLKGLIVTEGKINAFIHCFVAVRRITSLYDLEVAICQNEAVERFEDLQLGPLVRHPLVTHYFSVTSEMAEVFRITSEEIISFLCEFMGTHKEVQVEELLDFIAKKRSVTGREKLCVRIQSLGIYITHISQARRAEKTVLQKCLENVETKSRKKRRKRPLFASQKKQLDDNFSGISERIKLFSSENKDFCGKHVRFISPSSDDDDDSDNYESEDDKDIKDVQSHCMFSSQNVNSSDRVSNCPYPSAAEEMTRLGLKSETDGSASPASGIVKHNESNGPSKRKRQSENINCTKSVPRKFPRSENIESDILIGKTKMGFRNPNAAEYILNNDSMRMFITTWKEACRENTIAEVFERMLQFYRPKKEKHMKKMFLSYPCLGMLNVAVTSIKRGMWDSIYDAFHICSQQELVNTISEECVDYTSIEVEPAERNALVVTENVLKRKHGVTVDDIIEKISSYFKPDHDSPGDADLILKKKFIFLKKLCKCEFWLTEQFCVEEFESLGNGEFFTFLEKYTCLLPCALQKLLTVDKFEKISLEACMLQHQLGVLLSQASNSLWEKESISNQKISELLMRQFPSICFKLVESGLLEDFRDIVRENENNVVSRCILFSATLVGQKDSLAQNEKNLSEAAGMGTDIGHKAGILGFVTTKNAIEVLLRAPMLTDLDSWSHWDLIFAPSLGPLVGWLLNEVNTKELLCLVTRGGKVIRIDESATIDSFLKAFLQGSPFQTAVELLSLFSLYGGERNAPLSLLKCHAQKAFEVIVKNVAEVVVNDGQNFQMQGKTLSKENIFNEIMCSNVSSNLVKHSSGNKAASVASRFILDCLGYLPVEFRSLAGDILLSGLGSVVKDVLSTILSECKHVEQRLMLHEVGLSLGIMEWIKDYHTFRSCTTTELMASGPSCSKPAGSEFSTGNRYAQVALGNFPSFDGELLGSAASGLHNEECKGVHGMENNTEIYCDIFVDDHLKHLSELDKSNGPAIFIESIRREEFGLDPSLSVIESNMLKKQHARLGRALHCLSQELYSQDSHFLLELVQNADDNVYQGNVEPTLTFILQEGGIIVLNNEQGFSAENIRALCDVGNSTKKGTSAGYIGKKGIGFKSVFRVTDAPEIHSNGFHIKFDIRAGQIGFVLPTVVPPCNIEFLSTLASADTDQLQSNFWNTCIVLPFRSKLSEGFSNIITMFSDLHPSLLLFLHRLQCIKFRNMVNDSLIVMRKEIVGDGIIKVSHGKEKMTWFVVSQNLRADVIRPDVHTTEISIAFTLQESDNGNYIPHLDQQPVFAFLPLRTYGLKFILQGDFVLPSSREEVDGDSPWNQWLLTEFPGLFVSAERSFCDLPCFRENLGKAVAGFMSFVPIVGEVHGFFSCLPRMIISKLRMSNCLLAEGDNNEWVPPCRVLRNWTEQARDLLPDSLLREHLGLGFLNKDIVLSDSLARALGIEDYGPKILLQIISSLCHKENGLKSMGLGWLSSWLNSFYLMSFHSSHKTLLDFGTGSDLLVSLRKIPFIPLSDGEYGSVDEGTIWLHSDAFSTGPDNECGPVAFPKLFAKLRTVSSALFSASTAVNISCFDASRVENLTRMLYTVGVQRLSAHEIVKVHILPYISGDINGLGDMDLMTEYLSFVMLHLHSSCPDCCVERELIIADLYNKAFILTNHGFKRPVDVPIHFNKEFGNHVDVNKLINGIDVKWHEVDICYLKHPITKLVSDGMLKWRKFFQELGITEFVRVVKIEKSVADITHVALKNMVCDRDMISPGSLAEDWESPELVHLLTQLSSSGDRKRCKYLLEIFDTLWDDCFSDKVTGYMNFNSTGERKPFKSTFMSILYDFRWIVSSMDDDFHYPTDLFHDCEAVRSILGDAAPYAVPEVRSENLLKDIGFKTKVTLDDILTVFKVWRGSETPFKASIAQMSKFYTFIWNEMATSKEKNLEVLCSGAFIFVPYSSGCTNVDVVPGVFLSRQEVYWHDVTGSTDQMKIIHPQHSSDVTHHPYSKMLCNFYPGLHDFFVNECGVEEIPPFHCYLQILLQLSTVALPSQAAKIVFQVFLKWAEELNSGLLRSEDVEDLKESLLKMEFMVLPTAQDKWVSLHPSFGIVCWGDDEKLKKEFKYFDNIEFLYFGELSDDEKEKLNAMISILMQRLEIPSLSKIITREAIYYGPADSEFKTSLVNWALPYAQRYVYNVHTDKYFELKHSGFENLSRLQIVVVEKLFYRNVIKRSDISSTKRFECSCLLQGTIMYTTQESDSHSIFMELSRLLIDEVPQLHLANFLHMITTMAESGSSEEQIEFFILNSQKVPKLPDGELIWSLPSELSSTENDKTPMTTSVSTIIDEFNPSNSKKKPGINSSWPPVDWKTAPGFGFAHANGLKTQAGSNLRMRNVSDAEELIAQTDHMASVEITADWIVEDDPAPAVILQDSETSEDQLSDRANNMVSPVMNVVFDSIDLVTASDFPNSGSFNSSGRDQLSFSTSNGQQALLTGRLGEFVAFKYFLGKVGGTFVKWVNEASETGLPYDITIGNEEKSREYIEVKATKSGTKNWFEISVREWQFAVERGESFSIAHVVLASNNAARVTIYKNPARLCKLGKLKLAVVMPKQTKGLSIIT